MNDQTSPWGEVVANGPIDIRPSGIALSSDNKRVFLVTANGGSLTSFDAATLNPIAGPIKIEGKRGIAFLEDDSPGNGRILVGESADNGVVTVCDALTLERIGEPIRVFGDNPVVIRVLPGVSPNKTRIFVLHDGGPGNVTAIDAATLKPIGEPAEAGDHSISMDVMPANASADARFFVANFGDHNVSVCDCMTLERIGEPIPIVFPISVAIAPAVASDNPRLFIVHSNTELSEGFVTVFDAVTLKQIGQPLLLEGFHTQIAVSADNAIAVALGDAAKIVTALDPVTLKQIGQPIPLDRKPEEVVAIASDHTRVFVCTESDISAIEPTRAVD